MEYYNEVYDYGYDKNFLFKDRQLGQNVIINGINVYDSFDADLISYTFNDAKIDKSIYKKIGKYDFNINTFKYGDNSIQLMFYIGGHNKQEAQINVNKLLKEFDNKVTIIKLDETDFEYVCVIDSYKSEYTNVEFYYLVTIVASAVKRLPCILYTYDSSYFTQNTSVTLSFENIGIINSGLDIIVRVSGSDNFELQYKRNNGKTATLHFTEISTSNYYYKVGGLDGVIYRSGNADFENNYINVFENTDLVDFPIVKPGQNEVTFIQPAVGKIKEVRLMYYPMFLI